MENHHVDREMLEAAMEKDIGRERREKVVRHANGTLALEGLHVTKEAREDQLRYIRGEISAEDGLARAVQRHKKI